MPDVDVNQLVERAHSFLGGEVLRFKDANDLRKKLAGADELSLARQVLKRTLHKAGSLSDGVPPGDALELNRQHAMLTSKDAELPASVRHHMALRLLRDASIDIWDRNKDVASETLGLAAGIYKRLWSDLGRLEDLISASKLYQRGAEGDLGDDAYPHINAAFVNDVLAAAGDSPVERTERATELRLRIVKELKVLPDNWWNVATRAEALFGLREYKKATDALREATNRDAPWKLQTTARQLAHMARMQEARPLDKAEIREFFDTLLPGAGEAARAVVVGKVGLALSGGGIRASFYHLGVLAYLAERDVLRHVEVLSCVSGGSIVGASYWLALRSRLLDPKPLVHNDYVQLVRTLITTFQTAVAGNLRAQIQPSLFKMIMRLLKGQKGALDPEAAAQALERLFYRPLFPGAPSPIHMHDLKFEPVDHDKKLTHSEHFNPTRHNWLRVHKVPALILNATTVNTGHAWQFTPTWMGESPWAVHEAADSVPRLQWSTYVPARGWKIALGRAVAASACVPGVFAPLHIAAEYDNAAIRVSLVDGGVHDNQGTVSLLASDCNVLLVSDACGQLMLEDAPTPGLLGLAAYAKRSMDILMERIRWANFGDLDARRRSGLLRGFMFLHMKAGLDADVVRLKLSQDSYELQREMLSASGLRKDFQQALAELRTDLDDFSPNESAALMACGYQMASKRFEDDLPVLASLAAPALDCQWPFEEMRVEITSMRPATERRDPLLAELRHGNTVRL